MEAESLFNCHTDEVRTSNTFNRVGQRELSHYRAQTVTLTQASVTGQPVAHSRTNKRSESEAPGEPHRIWPNAELGLQYRQGPFPNSSHLGALRNCGNSQPGERGEAEDGLKPRAPNLPGGTVLRGFRMTWGVGMSYLASELISSREGISHELGCTRECA